LSREYEAFWGLFILNFLRLTKSLIAAVVIGSMSVVLAISFAALVYTGPLAVYLGEGIILTFFGAIVMVLVGSVFCSYRGYISGPQDVTAILIGSAAASIAVNIAPNTNAILPTIIGFVLITTLVTGVIGLLAGILKVGSMVRFTPYPVVAGFLASTGYLLVMGAFAVVFRETVDLYTFPALIADQPLHLWVPWIVGGFVLTVLMRKFDGELVLPLLVCLSVGLFYLTLTLAGIDIAEAKTLGLMLGPFNEIQLAGDVSFDRLQSIEWAEIFSQTPTILAVAGLAILGAMLHTTGFSATFSLRPDAERDLRGTGLANIAASFAGGLPGYMVLGESILARRMGLSGYLPAAIVTAAFALVLSLGTNVLTYLPAGLFALIISYLGFDLLWTWLWSSRKRLSSLEYATVGLIILVAAAYSFLMALGFGILAAALIFIYSYSNTEIIRMRSTIASKRSRVERSDNASAILSEVGGQAVILELSGFVFFGTADRLAKQAEDELSQHSDIRYLLLDFTRVPGIDASAIASMENIIDDANRAGVSLVLTGISPRVMLPLRSTLAANKTIAHFERLDSAIEDIENKLFVENGFHDVDEDTSLKEVVAMLKSDFLKTGKTIRQIELSAGEQLLESGALSSEVYVLEKGRLKAEIENSHGKRIRVAEFRPYALVGEIAFYATTARTAWVVAEEESRVLEINLDAIKDSKKKSVIDLHKTAARSLARRVLRMTQLNRDAEL